MSPSKDHIRIRSSKKCLLQLPESDILAAQLCPTVPDIPTASCTPTKKSQGLRSGYQEGHRPMADFCQPCKVLVKPGTLHGHNDQELHRGDTIYHVEDLVVYPLKRCPRCDLTTLDKRRLLIGVVKCMDLLVSNHSCPNIDIEAWIAWGFLYDQT